MNEVVTVQSRSRFDSVKSRSGFDSVKRRMGLLLFRV